MRGFTHAIFSGLTTQALARVIGDVLAEQPTLRGLFHVAVGADQQVPIC